MVDEKKKIDTKGKENRGERTVGGRAAYQKGSAQKEEIGGSKQSAQPEQTDVEGSSSEGDAPIVTRCPICGADLSGDLERCPECGKDLRPS